jgi:hypothetical protein
MKRPQHIVQYGDTPEESTVSYTDYIKLMEYCDRLEGEKLNSSDCINFNLEDMRIILSQDRELAPEFNSLEDVQDWLDSL